MTEPSLEQMEGERKEGFRPGVVVCLLFEKRLLMVYKVEHKLWQIPQGRVKAGETVRGAVMRVVGEELGEEVVDHVDVNMEVFGEDRMEFPENNRGNKKIEMEDGGMVDMKGKVYYFVAVKTLSGEINMAESEFGVARWVNMVEATELVEKIYQTGKQRVTRKVVEGLVGKGFILLREKP